jgi:hypothetical protein
MTAFLAGAVGGSLLLSGVLKLRQPAAFRAFLDSLVTRERWNRVIELVVPVLELATGGLLLTPFARAGALGALVVSLAFAVAALWAVRRSTAPGCGCFGALDATTPHWLTLVRALLLVAAALGCSLLLLRAGAPGFPARAGRATTFGVLSGIGLALTLTVAGQVIEFRNSLRALVVSDSDQSVGA